MNIPQKPRYLNILGVGLHEMVPLSTFRCDRNAIFSSPVPEKKKTDTVFITPAAAEENIW